MASLSILPSPKINPVMFFSDRRLMFMQCSLMQICPKIEIINLNYSNNTLHSLAPRNSNPSLTLASSWREIQGENDWDGLVEPLDPLFQREIIRYGEFVTACYKAFDLDRSSKRYLNCKYGKVDMLKDVGLNGSGYKITKYIYATPDINNIPAQNVTSTCGRWIGYIAICTDEKVKVLGRRDMIIMFRGTVTSQEWIMNFMSSLTPARLDPNNHRSEVKVETGLLNLYTSDEINSLNKKIGLTSCREQLLSEVSRLLNKYKGEEMSITVSGHSLGSSLALILAYDIAELGINKTNDYTNQERVPITVFSFAGPRVGNSAFKQRCDELGVKVLRVVNANDPITKLPGLIFNEGFRINLGRGKYKLNPLRYTSCYAHVGVEIVLDFFKMKNPSYVHDLEAYINILRYPKDLQMMKRGGYNFVERAKGVLLSTHNFNTLPWIIAACSMVNFAKSQLTHI